MLETLWNERNVRDAKMLLQFKFSVYSLPENAKSDTDKAANPNHFSNN
jgi:hypothetical protein